MFRNRINLGILKHFKKDWLRKSERGGIKRALPITDKQQAKVDMRKAARSTIGHDVGVNKLARMN